MEKKRSRFRKRIGAMALAFAMTLSMLSGITLGLPWTSAQAADDGDGELKIMMLDSSVQGADIKSVTNIPVNSDETMKALGVWADSVTRKDLMTIAQGTARMDGRNLVMFDLGEMTTFSGGDTYFTWNDLQTLSKNYGGKQTVKYSVEASDPGKSNATSVIVIKESENKFKDNHVYVVMEDQSANNLLKNYYGYLPNVENDSNGGKGWQLAFRWADDANVECGINAQGEWAYTAYDPTGTFAMSTRVQPLHNEVMRGGFKFHLQDVDLRTDGETQGTDDVNNAWFAIFNVSDLAMVPNSFNQTNEAGSPYPSSRPATERDLRSGKSLVETGYGYVTVYRDTNNPGGASDPGKSMFFPAYSVSEVMSAWRTYLLDSATASRELKGKPFGTVDAIYSNGLYGVDKEVGNGRNYKVVGDPRYNLFVMGQNSDGLNIVPCMVIKANNGVVDTGAYALPVGNYLVLQVKAGEGYYIDEDFAPIVSIGPWLSNGSGTAYPNIPAYLSNGKASELTAKQMCLEDSNGHPVAYVTAQTKESADLSTALTSFSVNVNGFGSSETMVYGNADTYISEHKYMVNPDAQVNQDPGLNANESAVGSRRYPVAGMSRFNAYDAIVRGGVHFYLADSDDVLSSAAQGANPYIAVPQGDGDLEGATFRLYNKPSAEILKAWTLENKEAGTGMKQIVGLGNDKVEMMFDSASYKEYTARYDAKTKQYVLDIPADDLPFGVFRLTQVVTGPGYGNWGDNTNPDWTAESCVEFTVRYIGVWQENRVTATYARGVRNDTGAAFTDAETLAGVMSKYRIPADNGALYLPQKLVTGGLVLSAKSLTGDDSAQLNVKVYNISDHYVYVDKDDAREDIDGGEERYETRQSDYNKSVKTAKPKTPSEVKSLLSGWTDSCVAEFNSTVGKLSQDVADSGVRLPYGTYVLAVTDLGNGLTVLSEPITTGKIKKQDDEIKWEILVGDKSEIPEISTVLVDTLYDIDSVAVDKDRSISDYVSLGNLKSGSSYVVYGMLVDKATGEMLPGSNVAYATASGYVSADTTPVTPDSVAYQLYETGRQFSDAAQRVGSQAYSKWLTEVQAYAAGRIVPGFQDQVMAALRAYRDDMDDATAYRSVMATLGRYGMGEADSSMLDGTAMVKLDYPHVPTNVLEGTTVVGYVYVCEGDKAEPNALSATSPSQLVGATAVSLKGIANNLNDEAETAYIPGLDITAKASYTGGKFVDPTETVTGTIDYSNVEPGNSYRLTATLKDLSGKDILGADGNPMVVTKDFVAKDTSGYEIVTFEGLDVNAYNGQRLTVYATLSRTITNGGVTTPYLLVSKGDGDSMGWKTTDPDPGKNQVDVKAPVVTTTLTDKNGNKDVNFDIAVSLVDKIAYRDLIPGEKYKSVLTLMGKDGKELYDDEGKALTTSITFTANASEQTVEIPIDFTGTKLQGLEIVAFNDLYHLSTLESLVAFEHNVDAASQTITAGGEAYKIHFTTSVTDDVTHTQYTRAAADAAITDSVNIRNLEPNTKYVLKTELAKANNGSLVNQFQPILTDVTSDADGTIKTDVKITANLTVFGGQTLVVYQTLYNDKETEVIAEHRDNTDMNQRFYIADIDTVLTGENGRSKKVAPDLIEHKTTRTITGQDGVPTVQTVKSYSWETTLADQIYYSNLIPGNTYMVTTSIVTQDGRGGTVGTSNLQFTPKTESGVFTVYIDLDVTDYMGKKLVAFETITDTYTNSVIMSHEDLTDEDQTIEIMIEDEDEDDTEIPDADNPGVTDPNNPTDPGSNPGGNPGKDIQTGVTERYGLYLAIAAVLAIAAAIGGVFYYKKRRQG